VNNKELKKKKGRDKMQSKKLARAFKNSAVFLITLSLSAFMLCGCGGDSTTTVVEEPTTVTEEPTTVEPTEEPTEAETTVNLPSDEYLVDYPITVGDQKVYLKTPDGFNTITTGPIDVTVFESEDTENSPFISYTVNHLYSIEYYREHTETGLFDDSISTIELTEETCDNGITIVKAETKFEYVDSIICYLIEYVIDDNITVQAYISDNPNIESILDFYRNTENVVVVY